MLPIFSTCIRISETMASAWMTRRMFYVTVFLKGSPCSLIAALDG